MRLPYFCPMKTNVLIAVILLSCSAMLQGCKKDSNSPALYFSPEQQALVIKQSIYYSVKLPPGATQETKFSREFDWYYDAALSEYDMRACFPEKDNHYYFLMTRKARSIWPAREAIGGKMEVDEKGKLLDYEEIYRTWKLTEDTLNERSFELFNLMKAGKDLTPYHAKFKGDRYIEFPDDRFYFDKLSRQWHDRVLDSLKTSN